MPGGGGTATIIIISATIGGIAVFVILPIVLLTIIICFVHAKGMQNIPADTGTAADDKGVTELATVIYDTPHVIMKEHNDQSAISTQDNVAYGGTIPLKQNEAYGQVHIN